MKHTIGALLLGGILLSAVTASAETTYTIDSVTIKGSKTVPVEKLYDAITIHKGSKATQTDVVADRDNISKVLEQANVGGNVEARMAGRGTHIDVVYTVNDQGVQAPVVTHVAPKLHEEIFDGNKSIDSDKLMAASGLRPGDTMSNQKVLDAEKAIGATYTAAKLHVTMNLSGETRTVPGGLVDVLWHIKETKLKARPSDESQESQDQIK